MNSRGNTKRLFFAINATDPLAKDFLPTFKKLKINADKQDISIKWVQLDNLHITVTFLGTQSVDKIEDFQEALKNVCSQFAPFDLKIEDVGAFANEHDARVLWLGVQNKKVFAEFKSLLDRYLFAKELLTEPDEREFSPHLTIGRLRNTRSVKNMISPFKRKSFGKIRVHEVILYESVLQGNFPAYIPLFRTELSGNEKPFEEESLGTTP